MLSRSPIGIPVWYILYGIPTKPPPMIVAKTASEVVKTPDP
jgi:hypothetical protein